jgi:hypothetical protein
MKQCTLKCRICDEFEGHVNKEEKLPALLEMRKALMRHERQQKVGFSDRIADFIVSKVLTMWFFYLCNLIAFVPLIWPQAMAVLQFVSSSWLQLIFLPLLGVVANRQEALNSRRAEREYRMLLLNDRIDELRNQELLTKLGNAAS